jgi:cytoskeletal protein CcmA (bactofilin family)
VSCPDEMELLRYTDRDLGGDALRRLEAHLIACRSCRGRVVALRDEAALLGDALGERRRPARASAAAPRPAPGVALGVPLAVGAVTVALAVLGFLLEGRLPGALDLLHPRRIKGAIEMGFDLVFLVRDRAPALAALALSLGVVSGVSAVGSFAVGVVYRRLFGSSLVVAAALLLAPHPAAALRVTSGHELRIGADEVVAEGLVVSADAVEVDGRVEGDLVVAAERVRIGGRVVGNVYVFAQELEITGQVEGAVYAVAERAQVDGGVAQSLYAAADDVRLAGDGRVGRDVWTLAQSASLGGAVGRDVVFGGDRLEIRGSVGRDVSAPWAERVALRDGARVAGSVDAHLPEGEDVERDALARVAGAVHVEPRASHEHALSAYRRPGFYLLHALAVVAAFVFGLVLHALVPGVFRAEVHSAGDFFRALGWGLVALVMGPVAIAVAALTLVGIPLAVLAAFAYVVALYTAEIAVASLLGRALWPAEPGALAFGRSLFVGLVVLAVLSHLPVLGVPVGIVALLLGLGLLFQWARALPVLRGA